MGKTSPNCLWSHIWKPHITLFFDAFPVWLDVLTYIPRAQSYHYFHRSHGGPFWIGLMLSGITLGAKLFLCFCFFHFFEPMVWRASTMHPSLVWTMKMQNPVSGTMPLPKKQENTLLFIKSTLSLNQKIKVLRLVQWCLCFSLPYFGHIPGYWASLLLEAISYFKRLTIFELSVSIMSHFWPILPEVKKLPNNSAHFDIRCSAFWATLHK